MEGEREEGGDLGADGGARWEDRIGGKVGLGRGEWGEEGMRVGIERGGFSGMG